MLKAAVQAKAEGICQPILLGNPDRLNRVASRLKLDLSDIEIIDMRADNEQGRRATFAKHLAEKRAREGYTFEEAYDKMVYHVNDLTFGPKYFIPKPVDPRLITEVSAAVAKAAMESGVARTPITDWEGYKQHLRELLGQETKLTRKLHDTARLHPQRVVFAEGGNPTMLKAAVQAKIGRAHV